MTTFHNYEATKVTHVTLWVDEPIELSVTVFPEHGSVCVDLGKASVHLRSAAAAQSVADAFAEAARQLGELEAQTATDDTPDGPSGWASALEEAA